MDHMSFIVLLSFLCLFMLAAVWYWHDRAMYWRRRYEEAQSWSDYFQDEAEARTRQQDALERQHGRLAMRYTELVRRRLAENYPIVEEAARRKN